MRLDAGDGTIDQAKALVGELSPINLALGPLVNNAIASGNDALAQRLEQLRNIIEEALFNLNKIIAERTTQINSDAEGRLAQLNGYVSQNLSLLNDIASGQISEINADTASRIDQLGDKTGNLIEALPIPAQPLPNVPSHGFTIVRASGAYTPLFITGAGLRKGGTAPQGFVLNGDSSDVHYFSHNGTSLPVRAASMGLVELAIPTEQFPGAGQVEKILILRLRSGNVLPTYVEPSFPLLLCSHLPQYSVIVTREAMGQVWERRVVPHPRAEQTNNQIYIDNGDSNNSINVCADDADVAEWKADPDVQHYGLEYAGLGEHVGATFLNVPRLGCVRLYAGRDSSGGGWAKAWGLQVHQRRLQAAVCGRETSQQTKLKYGMSNDIAGPADELLARCVAATGGGTVTPSLRTKIVVTDDGGRSAEEDNLSVVPRRLMDGAIAASVSSSGLVKLTVTPGCGRP